MAHRPRGGGPRREDDDSDPGDRERERYHEHEREPFDDAGTRQDRETPVRRGSATDAERYAQAREQWYRLPGSVTRPSMDPTVGDPAPSEPHPPGASEPNPKGPGQ